MNLSDVQRMVTAFWSRNVFFADVVRVQQGRVLVRQNLRGAEAGVEGPYSINRDIGMLRTGDLVMCQRVGSTVVVVCAVQTRNVIVEAAP